MDIPVLIEPVPGNGCRTKSGEPFAKTSEGKTPQEALEKLKEAVAAQLDNGSQIVSLQVPSTKHRWKEFAGMFREDDPTIQEWLQIVQSQWNESEAD